MKKLFIILTLLSCSASFSMQREQAVLAMQREQAIINSRINNNYFHDSFKRANSIGHHRTSSLEGRNSAVKTMAHLVSNYPNDIVLTQMEKDFFYNWLNQMHKRDKRLIWDEAANCIRDYATLENLVRNTRNKFSYLLFATLACKLGLLPHERFRAML
jgi:hypothetical protein